MDGQSPWNVAAEGIDTTPNENRIQCVNVNNQDEQKETANETEIKPNGNTQPPDSLQDDYYNLNYDSDNAEVKQKIAIIFNQENFDIETKRVGTNLDAEGLKNCLESFGFKATVHQDKTKDDVLNTIEDVSKKSSKDVCCIIIVVMTHGDKGGILCAKDFEYNLLDIAKPFLKKTDLDDVPILFVIQACRGQNLETSVPQPHDGEDDDDDELISERTNLRPNLLFAYSTFEDYSSLRREKSGSWFIQEICKQLETKYEKHDLVQMLTFASGQVANMLSQNRDPDYDKKTEIPVIESTLTKLLKFKNIN